MDNTQFYLNILIPLSPNWHQQNADKSRKIIYDTQKRNKFGLETYLAWTSGAKLLPNSLIGILVHCFILKVLTVNPNG